jgi:hypothetical protein
LETIEISRWSRQRLSKKIYARLLKIYAQFINSLDDYQRQTAQRRSWLCNNHAKNARCELLANGTTMTRTELLTSRTLASAAKQKPRDMPGVWIER